MNARADGTAWQAAWPRLVDNTGRIDTVEPGGRARTMATAGGEDERLRALMTGYQAGRRDAFEDLYAALAPALRGYLQRLARDPARADDLLQDTFLQIHRARHTYDPAYPVRPWAYAVARHAFLMDCRYRSRRADLSRQEELSHELSASASDQEEALVARDEVAKALGQLTPGTRRSVLLHHVHGLSFDEISRRLGVNGPALRARASRGLARLRAVLDDKEAHRDRD
jgi:RNA polymerase sigma-70 factor, ECF subfamily